MRVRETCLIPSPTGGDSDWLIGLGGCVLHWVKEEKATHQRNTTLSMPTSFKESVGIVRFHETLTWEALVGVKAFWFLSYSNIEPLFVVAYEAIVLVPHLFELSTTLCLCCMWHFNLQAIAPIYMLCLASNVIVRSDSPCVHGFSNQNQRNIYLFLGLVNFRKELLVFLKFELTPFGFKQFYFTHTKMCSILCVP